MSLVSSLYSNPNNAASAYDVSASKSANRNRRRNSARPPRSPKYANPRQPAAALARAEKIRAISLEYAQRATPKQKPKALNRLLNSSPRQHGDASTQGTGNA